MRLAETPVPSRAAGEGGAPRAGTAPAGPAPEVSAGQPDPGSPAGQPDQAGQPAAAAAAGSVRPAVPSQDAFALAVSALLAGRDAVAAVRDDLELDDWPAPQRLAPRAAAIAATAYRDGAEAGTARLILLHDPSGRDEWPGTYRVVVQVHADVEAEMATDPLLGEVGWSWLTDALSLHAPGFLAPSGTVTRVITEGYGGKEDDPPSTAFELRASWAPAAADLAGELRGAVVAWADVLAAAAGLPSQPPGTRALGRRRAGRPGRGTGRGGTGLGGPGPGGRRR